MTRRVVILVCDGLGVGAAPDAEAYGDAGSDTLGYHRIKVEVVGQRGLKAHHRAGYYFF